MPRQRGSTSIIIRKRPPIGPVRLIKFIRQRLIVFSLTLFTMLGGCKGRRVQPHLPSRLTRQMSVHPKPRAVRQLSRVRFQTVCLLQTNKANRRREDRLPWPRQCRDKIRGWNLPILRKQLNSRLSPRRARRLRKRALSHNHRYLNRPQFLANRQPRRNLSELKPRTLRLLPTNRITSRPLSKQVRPRNPLRHQRPQTSRHPSWREWGGKKRGWAAGYFLWRKVFLVRGGVPPPPRPLFTNPPAPRPDLPPPAPAP